MKKVLGEFLVVAFVFAVGLLLFFPAESSTARRDYEMDDHNLGIIHGDRVNVRAKPDLSAKVYTQLFKGDRVRSLDEFYWKEDRPGERVWHLVEVLTVKGKKNKSTIRGWVDCTFIEYPPAD